VTNESRLERTAWLFAAIFALTGWATLPAAAGDAEPGILRLVPFVASAFPYEGRIPDQDKPFLDMSAGERRAHSSPRGGLLWADQTYSDRRVLLYVPPGFDPRRPAVIVVYFHGNQATLERDVQIRQQVPGQLRLSGLNAVLVAPQLAVDALDSSAGHFWDEGFFARFLDEAAAHLAVAQGAPAATFRRLPVVIVAYSGGYLPAAFSIERGGAGDRLRGVILLDALFGEVDRFARWIEANRDHAFFVSAASKATVSENAALRDELGAAGVSAEATLPARLHGGEVVFLTAPPDVTHNDFVTRAWVNDPLQLLLAHVAGYGRPRPAARKAKP
jgi:hypothetical protein